MMQLSVSSLANIMQDIGTESIQLQTIMDGSVWLPHDTVLACPPLANIIQDIVTDTKLLHAIKNWSVWLPHDRSYHVLPG